MVRSTFWRKGWLLAAFLAVLAGGIASPCTAAEKAAREEGYAKGFRGLPWGASVEEAARLWPDLARETFGADGEPDHYVRDRSKEDPRIEGTRFDRIEHLFRAGGYAGFVATIRTNAGRLNFSVLKDRIQARAGKPREAEENRAAWKEGRARVELSRRLNSVWLRVTVDGGAP